MQRFLFLNLAYKYSWVLILPGHLEHKVVETTRKLYQHPSMDLKNNFLKRSKKVRVHFSKSYTLLESCKQNPIIKYPTFTQAQLLVSIVPCFHNIAWLGICSHLFSTHQIIFNLNIHLCFPSVCSHMIACQIDVICHYWFLLQNSL